jgi:IclR family transcriptional regulator, pca regulon regulatory protein
MGGDEESPDQTRSSPTLRQARYSHSLGRGLAILACYTPERPVLGIAELAEQLGISRSTTHRYVRTLVSLGYLEQDASRKYRLALGAIDLGAALNATGLCKHAHPELEALSRRSGYTAEIAVLDGPKTLLVGHVLAGTGTAVDACLRLPAYCTSMGKVLLAYLPSEPRAKLISEMELIECGPGTITSKAALHAQLENVRSEGFAIDDEELMEGTRAIAAPVREESGDVIAAVGLVTYGRVIEVDELTDRFGGALLTTAARVSRRIGWRGEGA